MRCDHFKLLISSRIDWLAREHIASPFLSQRLWLADNLRSARDPQVRFADLKRLSSRRCLKIDDSIWVASLLNYRKHISKNRRKIFQSFLILSCNTLDAEHFVHTPLERDNYICTSTRSTFWWNIIMEQPLTPMASLLCSAWQATVLSI